MQQQQIGKKNNKEKQKQHKQKVHHQSNTHSSPQRPRHKQNTRVNQGDYCVDTQKRYTTQNTTRQMQQNKNKELIVSQKYQQQKRMSTQETRTTQSIHTHRPNPYHKHTNTTGTHRPPKQAHQRTCQSNVPNFLKQKIRPIRMRQNVGKMASPGPARHKIWRSQTILPTDEFNSTQKPVESVLNRILWRI